MDPAAVEQQAVEGSDDSTPKQTCSFAAAAPGDSAEFAIVGAAWNTSFSSPPVLASAAELFEPDCCQIAAAALAAAAAAELVQFDFEAVAAVLVAFDFGAVAAELVAFDFGAVAAELVAFDFGPVAAELVAFDVETVAAESEAFGFETLAAAENVALFGFEAVAAAETVAFGLETVAAVETVAFVAASFSLLSNEAKISNRNFAAFCDNWTMNDRRSKVAAIETDVIYG